MSRFADLISRARAAHPDCPLVVELVAALEGADAEIEAHCCVRCGRTLPASRLRYCSDKCAEAVATKRDRAQRQQRRAARAKPVRTQCETCPATWEKPSRLRRFCDACLLKRGQACRNACNRNRRAKRKAALVRAVTP